MSETPTIPNTDAKSDEIRRNTDAIINDTSKVDTFFTNAERQLAPTLEREKKWDLNEPVKAFNPDADENSNIQPEALAPAYVSEREESRPEQLARQFGELTDSMQVQQLNQLSHVFKPLRATVTQERPGYVKHNKAGLFQKTLSLLTGAPNTNQLSGKMSERQLIELEAEVGGKLFGPIPAGHRREFFCLDEHTWIWHEEWVNEDNLRQITSTRYEVHEGRVLKAQDGKVYKFIEGDELRNLAVSARLYYETVARDIYHRDPTTGQPLPLETATI